MEGNATAGRRLGIRRRVGSAGDGLLGTGAMKPLTNTKTMPHPSARPALNRPPTAEERRRAQRVLLRINVVVHVAGKPPIQGHTHTVSASGAMITMSEPLAEGTK